MTSDLAHEHCLPCEGGVAHLDEAEAAKLAERLPEWSREGTTKITREFPFKDFSEAFAFVARIALIAEAEGHHPDIELGWGRVAVALTTHAAGGLTRNDFVLATKIQQLMS